MNALLNIIKDFPRYLWNGWGAIASIFLFFALWEFGHQHYGDLILPSPKDTLLRMKQMLQQEAQWQAMQITVKRAIWGFLISIVLGSVLGLLSGLFVTASIMSRPLITILMGMPPIAWIVLAMIWFGMGDKTVIFTVVVAAFPIVFAGALQGTRTLENHLNEMADSFNTPLVMKFTDIYFPHIFSYITT